MSRRTWLLLLILTCGAGLRLGGLDSSLRVDEIEIWAHARQPLGDILADHSRQPHASVISRVSSAVLGDSETAVRLPFVLYGIACLPLLFLLGREAFDEETGLWACLLLAFSPYGIRFAQEARYYAPLMFYSLSALYCMLRLLRLPADAPPRVKALWWTGFALSHAFNLQLHQFALYPLTLCALGLLVHGIRAKKLPLAGAAGTLCLLSVILHPRLFSLWKSLQLEAVAPGNLTLGESYLRWHHLPPHTFVLWEGIKDYSDGALLGALCLGLAAAGILLRPARLRTSLGLALWVLLPLLSIFVLRAKTHFEFRYLIFILPVWLLLAASGLSAAAGDGRSRLRRSVLFLGAGLILSLDAASLSAYYRNPRSRLKDAFSTIAARCAKGDAVIPYPGWDVLWQGYYALPEGCRLLHPSILMEGAPAFSLSRLVAAHPRLWLTATWIEDPERAREFHGILGSLERYYSVREEPLLRSSDHNDDQHVWSLLRRTDVPLPALASPPAGAPREKDFSRGFGGGRRPRMTLNITEAAESLSRSGTFALPASPEATLLVLPKDSAAGRRAAEVCGTSCLLFAWSGAGTLERGGTQGAFQPGDLLSLAAGERPWTGRAPGGAVLLRIVAPAPPAPESGAAVRLLANADRPPPPAPALHGGLEVSIVPLGPGERRRDAVTRSQKTQWVTGIVLKGTLRLEKRISGVDFQEGDVYIHPRHWPSRWTVSNRSAGAAVLLQIVKPWQAADRAVRREGAAPPLGASPPPLPFR